MGHNIWGHLGIEPRPTRRKPPSPPRPPPSPPKPPAKPRLPPRKPRVPQKPPALPPSPPRRPPSPPRTRNGVRLTRGAGRIGRLEVSFKQEYYPAQWGYTENGGWAPLCDDGSVGPDEAIFFCQQLGFKTGRQYYAAGISDFGADEVNTPTPVGGLLCDGFPPEIPVGMIAFQNDDDPTCFLFRSDCSEGALVALQCSNANFTTPSRPPPPRAAGPPPRAPPPPDMPDAIKVLDLEPNLVDAGGMRAGNGRVEVLVNSSAGEPVWAPLCATAEDLALYNPPEWGPTYYPDPVANTSCNQEDPRTNTWNTEMIGFIRQPVPIPNDTLPVNSEANLFNPAKYTHWVTVVGGKSESKYALQAMDLQVSTTPCATGYMYSLACQYLTMYG
ncbi:hypothetical protein VOLCADRAFT_103417 [Volvox carteri f. nagariensis]|uniref:SRCR domain-containing protein n=1 Tax=Volvox carteri f. nagariensis TaxID=3068 RepID=D8TLQ9_VOLCA|nr:uncharacterized protein VOLCADRAFT_103417 [Volvox carteri f. nagariensis]EFJ51372.1 hypothetical protein VOLCADRAFT_103417 [Volvox carteri f. nagariensis]|eukprot:XP_002947324.1 hypothetical protein VOLCADRAFT_103417 [Volvox carteri f. nagariensis]